MQRDHVHVMERVLLWRLARQRGHMVERRQVRRRRPAEAGRVFCNQTAEDGLLLQDAAARNARAVPCATLQRAASRHVACVETDALTDACTGIDSGSVGFPGGGHGFRCNRSRTSETVGVTFAGGTPDDRGGDRFQTDFGSYRGWRIGSDWQSELGIGLSVGSGMLEEFPGYRVSDPKAVGSSGVCVS